jgi:hypothetical protein
MKKQKISEDCAAKIVKCFQCLSQIAKQNLSLLEGVNAAVDDSVVVEVSLNSTLFNIFRPFARALLLPSTKYASTTLRSIISWSSTSRKSERRTGFSHATFSNPVSYFFASEEG